MEIKPFVFGQRSYFRRNIAIFSLINLIKCSKKQNKQFLAWAALAAAAQIFAKNAVAIHQQLLRATSSILKLFYFILNYNSKIILKIISCLPYKLIAKINWCNMTYKYMYQSKNSTKINGILLKMCFLCIPSHAYQNPHSIRCLPFCALGYLNSYT